MRQASPLTNDECDCSACNPQIAAGQLVEACSEESEPFDLYYETEGMAHLRSLLTNTEDVTNEQFDTFKAILSILENHRFHLIREN